MVHPLEHDRSSVRRFGGRPEDYIAIHNWFDESKAFFADFRHRALRHHTEGIFLAERIFGISVFNCNGSAVPVRYVGEQHVREDLGRVPTVEDWLTRIHPQRWMYGQRLRWGLWDANGFCALEPTTRHGIRYDRKPHGTLHYCGAERSRKDNFCARVSSTLCRLQELREC
jgi:hypothetical protein